MQTLHADRASHALPRREAFAGVRSPVWTWNAAHPSPLAAAQDQQSLPRCNLLPICIVNAIGAPLYPSGGYQHIIYLLCCLKITLRNINANLTVKRLHQCRDSDWGMFSPFINAK